MPVFRLLLLCLALAGMIPEAHGRSVSEACGSFFRLIGIVPKAARPSHLEVLERKIAKAEQLYREKLATPACQRECLRQQREHLENLWNERSRLGKGYRVIGMGDNFQDEHRVGYVARDPVHQGTTLHQTKYLNDWERDALEVFVDDQGLLVNAEGVLINTCFQTAKLRCHANIFVMDADGRIFMMKEVGHREGELREHHSSFLAGAPVAAAGGMKVHLGRLVTIDNDSGHYKTPAAYLDQALIELKKRGAQVDGVGVEIVKPKPPLTP